MDHKRKEINLSENVSESKDGEMRELSKPLEQEPKQPDVIEKVIYIDRRRGRRLARLRRILTLFGCLPIFFCCFGVIFIFATKTDPFWSWTVGFLNNDVEIDAVNEDISYEIAQSSFEDQINSIGENQIVLNNSELTALANHNLSELPGLIVNSENDVLKLFWEVESTGSEPLYGRIDIRIDENEEPYISYVGLNNIGLPSSFTESVVNSLLPVLQFRYGGRNPQELLSFLLTGNEKNELSNIAFSENEVSFEITINLTVFEE